MASSYGEALFLSRFHQKIIVDFICTEIYLSTILYFEKFIELIRMEIQFWF